ncbi:MAG TPA: OmpA family protein [Paracoccaceae bacterium]|nr:OmpA family protein [Paracoccaceae bacterium]
MIGYRSILRTAAASASLCLAVAAAAQEAAQEAPESLKIYFETGSAAVAADQAATLDQAARLFRDGNPIVMIVAGVADTVGPDEMNLALSVRRAEAVAAGLADRGIPAARLQVLGRGNSELEVQTGDNVAEPENRVVEITWR